MIKSLANYFWEKIISTTIFTIPACFFNFNQSQLDILYGIVYIVILDTFLGCWVALKYKTFNSHNLSRVFAKIGTYGLAMASAWIVAAVEPHLAFAFRYVGIFIIITEVISNFEKLALIGFKIPTQLMAKINSQFKEFLHLEKEEKEEKAEDILKNRGCAQNKK